MQFDIQKLSKIGNENGIIGFSTLTFASVIHSFALQIAFGLKMPDAAFEASSSEFALAIASMVPINP